MRCHGNCLLCWLVLGVAWQLLSEGKVSAWLKGSSSSHGLLPSSSMRCQQQLSHSLLESRVVHQGRVSQYGKDSRKQSWCFSGTPWLNLQNVVFSEAKEQSTNSPRSKVTVSRRRGCRLRAQQRRGGRKSSYSASQSLAFVNCMMGLMVTYD